MIEGRRGKFLAVDWGTTNRRVYRIADGAVEATQRDDRGLLAVALGGFRGEAAESGRGWATCRCRKAVRHTPDAEIAKLAVRRVGLLTCGSICDAPLCSITHAGPRGLNGHGAGDRRIERRRLDPRRQGHTHQ